MVSKEKFIANKALLESGVSSKALSQVSNLSVSTLNRMARATDFKDYKAIVRRLSAPKAKKIKVTEDANEPIKHINVNSYVREATALPRIADALERLADAWENVPKKKKFF